MLNFSNKHARRIAAIVGLSTLGLSLFACGGDSSNDSNDDGNFTLNACEAIGLKVANGIVCDAGDNPADTSIVRLSMFDRFGDLQGSCTGVVISPTAVLTAAHCLEGSPDEIDVGTFVGVFPAQRWVSQPDYTQSGGVAFGDSALVFTSSALPLPVAPILSSRAPRIGEEAIVSGFGETEPGSGATDEVIAGNAIVTNVSDNHVTINFTPDEAHPCAGDSGGPLLVDVDGIMTIVGVVSQSDPSVSSDTICRVGDMTLYTNTRNAATQAFILGNVPNVSLR